MMAKETREVFVGALGLPHEARQRYLDSACPGHPELRQRVEELLKAYEEAEGFMEQPPICPHAGFEGPGSVIGRYCLLEEIGQGGFGRVFMAQQLDPVRRRVALKIIKAGMDTRQVVARFDAERQALALMDHPGIARVLDGGATDAGRPYFVMELVNGIPITDYCDRYRFGTVSRLELFLKVCRAIQHAHQKGIIHRDLKPGNILVTVIDGEPVPKIIDFGVAKALGHKLTEETLFTSFQQLVGTPAYMSPEQAEFSGRDVDTRSDIYSLGVLLYELLTGLIPFDKTALHQGCLEDVRRLIRDREPLKPSTRLRGLGPQLTQVAQQRQSDPRTLTRSLRGELDWIVMKCLEKNRSRRYDAVTGLAQDIEHYLAHRPVMAGPPSKVYRMRKFIRRHRQGVAVAALVVLSLLIGLVLATTGLVRATRERNRAVAAELRADQVARSAQGAVELLNQIDWRPLNDLRRRLHDQGKTSLEIDRLCRQTLLRELSQPKQPALIYCLRLATPGEYQLWVRCNSPGARVGSVLAQIVELQDGPGGNLPDAYGFPQTASPDLDLATGLAWQGEAQREDLYAPAALEPACWRILQAGDYTLRFVVGEPGIALDAFVFQLADAPPPTAEGPPESAVAPDGAFLERNGRLVAEAEHASSLTTGASSQWLMVQQADTGSLQNRAYRHSGYVQAVSIYPE